MAKKFVRLVLYEGDQEALVTDDVGLPYEKLVETAYRVFKQQSYRVNFSLHYYEDTDDQQAWPVDQEVWNMGAYFRDPNILTAKDTYYCLFTPIERDNANDPDLGNFGAGPATSHPAALNVQLSSRSVGASYDHHSTALQDDMVTSLTCSDEESVVESQPKRKASPASPQGHSPRTYKKIRVFSPDNYGSRPKLAARGHGKGSFHRLNAVPQSPSFVTRRREAKQRSENVQSPKDDEIWQDDATDDARQSDLALLSAAQARASSSSTSPLSPVREDLFITQTPRIQHSWMNAAYLPRRSHDSRNVLDTPPRCASFDSRVLGQSTQVTEDAAGLYLDTVELNLEEETPRHGAPSRKNGEIEVTFFFKSEIRGHLQLKLQKWTVTYQGDETLRKRQKDLKSHIMDQLYSDKHSISERQRQGIIHELEIFIYVYYQNTDNHVDMLDRRYTDHVYQLWEFLLADIEDSEPARLNASVTMHRKSDVGMRLFDRLSPTGSRGVEGDENDDDDSDDELPGPIDVDAAEELDGDYDGDSDGGSDESDDEDEDEDMASSSSPVKEEED